MKQKKQKKLINLVSLILCVIIILVVIVVIYIDPFYLIRNNRLITNIESLLDKEIISLDELIPFEYDALYLYEPYTYKKDMEKEIGIKSRFIKDNYTDNLGTELIVIKDNKVISSVFINLKKNGFIIEGLVYSNRLDKNDDIEFNVTKSDLGIFIRQKLKHYNDSYYDIVYTVPGEWWKEDWEEYGYFYYLDAESNDYAIIRKEKLLDKNKFIKYAKKDMDSVEFKEVININNFEGYHLVCNKEDRINHYFSLNIKNESYVFIISGKENVIDNLYHDMITLLNSIKLYNEN